jgi:hypothetical protein
MVNPSFLEGYLLNVAVFLMYFNWFGALMDVLWRLVLVSVPSIVVVWCASCMGP